MKKPSNIREINTQKVTWLHLSSNSKKEIDFLRQNYNFHPLDLADCLSPAQRPKIDDYENYIFMIMTFPYYQSQSRQIMPSEVDFFLGPDYLITVSEGKLDPLENFFNQCQLNDSYRQKYLTESPAFLLSEILNKLQLYLYPMLDHINADIEKVENVIFAGYEKKMVKEILFIKRNIIAFRKILQAHRNVIRKLINKKDKFFIPNNAGIYLSNNLEQSQDVWDTLDSLKENIDALHVTNESLISFRLNDIMKVLTIISVVLLPVNLLATIFGMNTRVMPIVGHPMGFWIILGLMLMLIMIFVLFFKKKNWM